MGYDEMEKESVITLMTDDGEEVEFLEVAGIAYKDAFYAILQPVELLEGMEEDEALVFKVTLDENGEDNFSLEMDDEIIDGVFEEYNRLLDQADEE